jgi:hypothetical protein
MSEVKLEYFDEAFYKGQDGKGGYQDTLYQSNVEYGLRLGRAFRDVVDGSQAWTILDIGGGTGYRSLYYGLTTRCVPYNLDISEYAHNHSALPVGNQLLGNLLDVGKKGWKFDIVNCERVVSYLPIAEAEAAITNAVNLAERWFVFADITLDHLDQNLPAQALVSRKELAVRMDYLNVFKKLPLVLDMGKTSIMRETAWDGVWIFEVRR